MKIRAGRVLVLLAGVALLGAPAIAPSAAQNAHGHGTSSAAQQPAAQQNKPNIVFVLTDDLSMNLLPFMPNVRAMMADGMTFSNYFVTDSLCCPSRSSIFTGEFPHNTGVFGNSGPDGGYDAFVANNDEPKSYGLAMQAAGYRTAMMGKYLNGYHPDGDPPAPGWDEWAVCGAAYDEFDYDLNENGTTVHYGTDPEDYLTDVLAGKAQDFISSSAGQQPFMLEVSTFAPHLPATPAPRYANAVKNIFMPRTPNYGVVPTDPPTWLSKQSPLTDRDARNFDDLFRTRVRADLAVDDLVGALRQTLVAQGIADNTYLVFSSDNGFHMGEYRLQPGKRTAFDTDIHVPLVVVGPGVPAGRTTAQFASNVDLAPTFTDIAGLAADKTRDGISVLGLAGGHRATPWQRAVLIEHHQPDNDPDDPDAQKKGSGNPPDYEAIRTADALLVRYSRTGRYEYYDLTDDPWELHNVPDQAPTALKRQLRHLAGCSGTYCRRAALEG